MRSAEALDLASALEALVAGVPEPRIALEFAPDFRVEEPDRAQVLLRCAQESVTNAIRHARARHLWLRFYRTADGEMAMEARDDGQGAALPAAGNGLNGMRERLARIGGRLSFHSAPGRGFWLEVRLPKELSP
jgi:signal transduction histidine kinase